MISLTVYTIYGGIIDKEEIEITNAIHSLFNAVKRELGNREIDVIIRENIKYKINNIDIDKNTAIADIEITGVDLAQSFYEMDMYHAFYREFSSNNSLLFTEPIIDTYEVYTYILNKNKKNIQTSDLKLQLNKSDGIWNAVNRGDVLRTIEKSSVDLKTITDKANDNLEKAREMIRERYLQEEQTELTFEEYWANYLLDFITNAGYATQFPFEDQQFRLNNEVLYIGKSDNNSYNLFVRFSDHLVPVRSDKYPKGQPLNNTPKIWDKEISLGKNLKVLICCNVT